MTDMTITFAEGGGLTLDIVLSDAGGATGGPSAEDLVARQLAREAAMAAAENKAAIGALEAGRFAARLTVWPPNVAMHSGLQRNFKAILNELDEKALRLDGGATNTRFANRFQIKTRNADRAEVLLHSEAWSFTAEGAQELEWDVDAGEFNQLGTELSTDYIEVWGEFRAIYGGGVNEVRGRTQPFVIGFGNEPDWPATVGDVRGRLNLMVRASPAHLDKSDPPARVLFSVVNAPSAFPAADQVRIVMFGRTRYFPGYAPALDAQFFAWDLSDADRKFVEGLAAGTNHGVQVGLTDDGRVNNHAVQEVYIEVTAGGALTQAQRIALLALTVDPSGIPYRTADDLAAAVKAIDVGITNPELLTGDVWVEGWTQGQPSAARRKWATNIASIRLELSDATAGNVAANATGAGGDDGIAVRLAFFDAPMDGNEIERIGRNIPLTDRRDVAALDARNPTALTAIAFNAALALDWTAAAGPMRAVTLTDDTVISFANVAAGAVLILEATQDATGGHGITWPASVEWADETEIAPSSDAGAVDLFTMLALAADRVLVDAKLNIG